MRLWSWARFHWFGLLAAACHVQAARCHQAHAWMQERRFRLLEVKCVGKQASALKALVAK